MAMPGYRTVLGPPRRRRHERTACSSLANSDIAPSSFLEIPLLWGGEHWEGGLERAWRSQDLSSRSGGAKRTVILTMSRHVYRSPRVGRLIFWQDRPGGIPPMDSGSRCTPARPWTVSEKPAWTKVPITAAQNSPEPTAWLAWTLVAGAAACRFRGRIRAQS